MFKMLQKFISDESGATMVEYGLMVALIAVVCIVGVTFLGVQLNTLFNEVGGEISNVTPADPST